MNRICLLKAKLLRAGGCCLLALCLLLKAVPAGASGGISAKAYILIEASTGRVLAASREHERLPIASTTKILTALIALEEPGTEEVFTVDSAAIRVEGTSMGLREGDQVTLDALACGMLLSSGNDAANGAAVRIAGSVEAFAQLMNEKAASLGMTDSHFVTPSGLHDEDHYSTAADMATLARYALQNPRFAAICSQPSLRVEYGNPPFGRWLKNHNRLLQEYPGCIGLKTGFTKKAGRCLVSAARRNGATLICVTLDDPDDWRDHAALLDYGFSQIESVPLTPELSQVTQRIVGGERDSLPVKALNDGFAWVTGEQAAQLEQVILLEPFRYAPVKEGDVLGQVVYYYEGFEVARQTLLAAGSTDYDDTPPEKPKPGKLLGLLRRYKHGL